MRILVDRFIYQGLLCAKVIDFDDCGFGYWLYDIAVALWELRHRNDYGQFRATLIKGYTQHRPPPGDLGSIRLAGQCLVHKLTQLRADRVRAGREKLGKERDGQLFRRVDPERGAGRAAPRQLARRT
jgi:Ser/Thr protein kinase RdoA (MazF antagonist)